MCADGEVIFIPLEAQQMGPLKTSLGKTSEGGDAPVTLNDAADSLSGVLELLQHYTTICEQYEGELTEIKAQTEATTKLFETTECRWEELETKNAALLTLLEDAQRRNEALAARLEDVDLSSTESVEKVQTMQKRVDENYMLLQEKIEILNNVREFMESPSRGAEWQFRFKTIARTAAVVACFAMFAHYIWLLTNY
ncbi:hypothetical protein DFJ77DRAFT_513660 [Powellomyces hirtus]|nr:hypothetical protein DFJ77DRAFT_513660 [Powellomyces hirtus]